MMQKKRCVAMLLAGGQGSRLGVLTRHMAKPAVPYGGKYRIIDFPLSNCSNSGIDVVGVLTQYQPLELNAYIASGAPWDLDLVSGGVFVLPPYQTGKTGEWYKGTANAIYQNLAFIEQYQPDYVLILSGDHIYKMDYAAMIEHHIAHRADATIAVRQVPWEEASRFGIPAMLRDGQRMTAYSFSGYWKDVGTIESLWEANMDLLKPAPEIDLHDKKFRIYARNMGYPPQYIDQSARVENCLATEGCVIRGEAEHSVLSSDVTVEAGARVIDSVIMPGACIKAGARVVRAIVSENAVVEAGARVGEAQGLIAVVGQGAVVPENAVVAAGEQFAAQ